MRPYLVLIPLLALAACATPRESCINEVTQPLRTLNSQIAQSQEALSSGYTTESRREYRMVKEICRGVNDQGEVYRYECREGRWVEVPRRVAINRTAEEAKLASLLSQRTAIQRQIEQGVAACQAAHPE